MSTHQPAASAPTWPAPSPPAAQSPGGELPSFEEIRVSAYRLLGDAADWLRSDWRPGTAPGPTANACRVRAIAAIHKARVLLNDAAATAADTNARTASGVTGDHDDRAAAGGQEATR